MTDLPQHAVLARAFEERFGPAREWPLRIRAARMQLEQMSLLIGDDDYETFIRCAQTGVDRRSEAGARRGLHNDHLSRALYGLNGDDQSEAKAVAWGIMLGIINMLDDCEYEYVVRSATKALRMIPEAVAAR